jgi:hypothetical protein
MTEIVFLINSKSIFTRFSFATTFQGNVGSYKKTLGEKFEIILSAQLI